MGWFTILSILSSMQLIVLAPCWNTDLCPSNDDTCDERTVSGSVHWKQSITYKTTSDGIEQKSTTAWHTAHDYCKKENGLWVYESTCAVYKEGSASPTVFVAKTCPPGMVCAQGQCIDPTICTDPDNDFAYSKNAQYFTKNAVTETEGSKPPGPPIPDKCNAAPDHPQLLAEKVCVAIPGGAKLDTEYVDCAQFNALCDNGACTCIDNVCKIPCIDYIGPTTLTPLGECKLPEWSVNMMLLSNFPTWVGPQWSMDLLPSDEQIDDTDAISPGLEWCRSGTDPANSDTDGDGLLDAAILDNGIVDGELRWQRWLGAFESRFHPERGETNPLKEDTDQDGLVDGQDPCPLNAVALCNAQTCLPPAKPPPFTCTLENTYTKQWSGPTAGAIELIEWSDTGNVAIAVGTKILGSDTLTIFRSADGGVIWEEIPISLPTPINTAEITTLSMTQNGESIRIGTYNNLLKSDASGQNGTWTVIDPQTDFGLHAVGWNITPDGSREFLIGSKSSGAPSDSTFYRPTDTIPWQQVGVTGNSAYQIELPTDLTGQHVFRNVPYGVTLFTEQNGQFTASDVATAPFKQSGMYGALKFETDIAVSRTPNNFIALMSTPVPFPNIGYLTAPYDTYHFSIDPPGGDIRDLDVSADGFTAIAATTHGVWISAAAWSTPSVGAIWKPLTFGNSYTGRSLNGIALDPTGKTFLLVWNQLGTSSIARVTCP